MKLKLLKKLTLWTLSFLMVFNFMTFNLYYDFDLNKITYNETELVQETEALWTEAIYFVLYYLFASLMVGAGTDNTKVITDLTFDTLYQRYQDWYAAHDYAQNGSLKTVSDKFIEYIESTPNAQAQIDEMNQFVVPSYLMDDVIALWQEFELETNNYASYGYTYFNTYLNKQMNWFQPSLLDMQLALRGTSNMIISFMPISYGNGPTFQILNGLDFTTTKTDNGTQSQLRIKIRDKTGVQRFDFYSEKYNNGSLFDTAKYYMLAVEHVTSSSTLGDLYIFPLNSLFTDKYEIFTNRLKVNCLTSACSTSRSQVQNSHINYAYIPSSGSYVDNGGSIPDSWEDSDYYYVPIVPPETIETPINVAPPIPVPEEDENNYVPPTTIPGDTSGDWTNIGNPSVPAPTPTIDNLADGTFFENVANWFASIWTFLVNSVMGFWDAFVNNLWKVWDDMVNWWADLIPSNWFKGYWEDFAAAMIALIVPTDLNEQFTEFNAYFETKFGLLIYPIELIFDTFTRFATIQPNQCLVFSGYSDPVQNMQIIKPFTFCFDDFAEEHNIEWMFIMLQVFMNALIVYAFAMGWYKSYESIRDQ